MKDDVPNHPLTCRFYNTSRTNDMVYKMLISNKISADKSKFSNERTSIETLQNFKIVNAKLPNPAPHLIFVCCSQYEWCVSHVEEFMWWSSKLQYVF